MPEQVLRRFTLTYPIRGEPQQEGTIHAYLKAITEEGFDEPNGYEVRMLYCDDSEFEPGILRTRPRTGRYFWSENRGETERDFLMFVKFDLPNFYIH